MPIEVIGGTSGAVQDVNATSKAALVTPYDTSGNPMSDISSLSTVLNALNSAVTIVLGGQSTVAFDVESSSGSLTLAFEYTINNSNWYPLFSAPVAGGPLVSVTTGNGQYVAGCAGFYAVRARVSVFTSGSMTVSMNASPATGRTTGQGPNGSFVNAWFTQLGDGVNGPSEVDSFGSLYTTHRASQIILDFTGAFSSNPLGVITSGGGSTSQANGVGQLISGAAATASVFAQSYTKLRYQPGREIYAQFTAAFTTPTNVNSNQRTGLYDANNGFWVGYEGTAFGISKRNLGVTTSIGQSSFNIDQLTGTSGSDFTSGGVPVALDPTKLNLYRIRFGWLGGATISFQVMAPDGNWVTFHRLQQPNSSSTPSIATPNVPVTIEVNKTGADATSLIISTSSWDAGMASSNAIANASNIAPAGGQGGGISGTPNIGLDGGSIARVTRVSEIGTQRTTSEILLWHDAIEGATVNGFWTQSLNTMTVAQATGVLTLNNSNITTASTDAIITSQRQFPKYPRNPIYCRTRALITANVAANHTLVELGLGAPAGVTAVINNGAFFRWTAAGNLVGVVSFNGVEFVSPTLISQGYAGFSVTSYYYYDIIAEDDFIRFLVTDSNGVPLVDTQLQIPLTVPFITAVSHNPSFARVYTDATGGGTAVQLKISAYSVQMLDNAFGMTWQEQSAAMMRSALINPTSFAQTPSSMTAAPATLTPANASAGYATLGGEYAFATVVGFETGASIFGFQVPSPYTFMLEGLFIPPPIVATTIAVTGIPYIEWLIAVNATTNLLSTGGGFRQALGINQVASSAAAAQGSSWVGNGANQWIPKTPIACLPGTFLHIGFKILGTTAAGTPGLHRGTVVVDGHFF
jgi:hypothetical protein